MKSLKNKKGITLVALVITIVVLLILAVILINSINNNGIIGKAKEARNNYTNSAEKEQEYLTEQVDQIYNALDIATGTKVADGMIRDVENGLIYKVLDENAKTAEAYGDRGDIDYTDSNWLYNDILTTGDIVIKAQANINDTTYKVIRVGDESFGYDFYNFDFNTWQETKKQGYANITSVTIENGIEEIGYRAFKGCINLSSVNLPNTLTIIGTEKYDSFTNSKVLEGYVFSDCTSLAEITIPGSVTSIGSGAFYDCTSLSSITISNGVTSIGYNAFSGCTSLAEITIPSSVTSIGNCAFNGCTSLAEITMPSSATSIGSGAFKGCTSLSSIIIPNGVTSIELGTFNGCTSLEEIIIPSSVTSIKGSYYDGQAPFEGCTSLSSITIPNSVVNMEMGVFKGWTASQTINVYWSERNKPTGWDVNWDGYLDDYLQYSKIEAVINYAK